MLSFELFKEICKKFPCFHKKRLKSTTVFYIYNKKCFLSTKLEWFSEVSCDIEDWNKIQLFHQMNKL